MSRLTSMPACCRLRSNQPTFRLLPRWRFGHLIFIKVMFQSLVRKLQFSMPPRLRTNFWTLYRVYQISVSILNCFSNMFLYSRTWSVLYLGSQFLILFKFEFLYLHINPLFLLILSSNFVNLGVKDSSALLVQCWFYFLKFDYDNYFVQSFILKYLYED